ncbi:MAG TPA: diguanylate cyclase [Terriglobales bacterium]|nr:diguanylate cyclase [Terriglobales bacterium]
MRTMAEEAVVQRAAMHNGTEENWPVILAEGDKARRASMSAWLKEWSYTVVPAVNSEHALELLHAPRHPALALVGQKLSGLDGLGLCRKIKRHRLPHVYVVLLADKQEEQGITAGLKAGADDCLQEPFRASDLHMRLRAGQRILQLQQKLEAAQQALKFGTTHDALTGIWNREMIAATLDRELARALRNKKPLGVLKLDLCHLREINRLHGHQAGDAVLQEVAQRLRSSLRTYDAVGRYGAEEFLIIIPEIAPENLSSVLARLRASVVKTPIATCVGPVSIAVSMGASAMGAGTQGLGAHFLLHAADVALYLSRRSGRNCVRVCGSEDRVLVSS